MKRVLVSGASGIVGYGILRSLRQCNEPCFLVGTSVYDDSIAPAFCDAFEQAPPTIAAEYLEWLLATLRKHRIDLLIPGIEADVFHWIDHANEIRATGAVALLNNPQLVGLCKDKWIFYQQLQSNGFTCAIETSLDRDFEDLAKRFGLPFLLKPRRGFGGKGILRITDEDHFNKHRDEIGPVLMAQKIIGSDDNEFTTSAFCNGSGSYSASITLRRKLSSAGFTEWAEVANSEEFAEVMRALCTTFRPLGPTNFQFRRCATGPKLLEINPRISSSTAIRAAFGYNESLMALDFFLEKRNPIQPPIRRGRAIRYTEEHIFYEDGFHF